MCVSNKEISKEINFDEDDDGNNASIIWIILMKHRHTQKSPHWMAGVTESVISNFFLSCPTKTVTHFTCFQYLKFFRANYASFVGIYA